MRLFLGVILPILVMAITGMLVLRYLSSPADIGDKSLPAIEALQGVQGDSTMADPSAPPPSQQAGKKIYVSPAGQAEASALANEAAQVVGAFNMYVGTMAESLPKEPNDLVTGGFISGIPNPPASDKGAKFFFARGLDGKTMALATRIFSRDTCNAINQSALATVKPIISDAGPFAPDKVDIAPAISGTSFSCAHFNLAGSNGPEYYYLRRLR